MLKGLLGLAATGVAAVVAWKLTALVLLPLLGIAVGVLAFIIKMVFLLVVLLIAYWIYRRMSRDTMTA